jgi:hypothetical protein
MKNMKALIKRASFSVFLIVSAPFSAFADLIDAQRALLNRQFSSAHCWLTLAMLASKSD